MNVAQRTRIRLSALTMMILMFLNATYSQYLGSARSTGLGAATVFSNDLTSIDWNPAALSRIRDWEVSLTSYYSSVGGARTTSLQSTSIGAQIGYVNTVALKLSPGASLDFVVPSSFALRDSSQSLEFDKQISYSEQFAAGNAYRPNKHVSFGLSIHRFEEKVTDTRYSVDSNSVIHSLPVEYTGDKISLDLGGLWEIDELWSAALVGKNVVNISERPLDQSVERYELRTPFVVGAGIGFQGFSNTLLALDVDSKPKVRIGGEWSSGAFPRIQAGMYFDASSSFAAEAASFGIGGTIQPVRLGLSYLAFISQDSRRGTSDVNAFLGSGVDNLEYNEYTSDRLSLTASVSLGRTHEQFVRIEGVDMSTEIFPACRKVYAMQPIGKAIVRNMITRPVNAKLTFHIDGLMDAPTQAQTRDIMPGEIVEIPLYAVFNERMSRMKSLEIRDAEVSVTTGPGDAEDDRFRARVLVHGKNDWNGDVRLLKYFVTPDEPEILEFTRNVLSEHKAEIESTVGARQNLERARILFDTLAKRQTYVSDPKKSLDLVQYPSETMHLSGGDCDDMSVCYSALLASIGISTAFIDVIPPGRPEEAHIYMMFDTGIEARSAGGVSDNPKRYVIRRNDRGKESVWIPIETTQLTKGFEEAWKAGAKEYFDDVELNLGIVRGWVKLVDYEAAN